MDLSLIIPAFIAGILTFLAPCTLPLVPGYLGFISGVSVKDLDDPKKVPTIKRKVLKNGIFYVIGFSLVFIIMGSVFGLAGSFLAQNRVWLSRIGGVFVIFFGLYLMHIFNLPVFSFMNRERKFNVISKLTPGDPLSSLIFGATFAFGWTPCVGPVLGSILLLASTSGTVFQGAFLLLVFSIGLGIPFIIMALALGHATGYIKKLSKYLNVISFVGGVFLVFLGILLVSDNLSIWVSYFYQLFDMLGYEAILDYL